MDILPLTPRVNAAEIPLQQLAGNAKLTQQEKVGEACRQFEAILLRQILSEARKPVIDSGSDEDQTTSGIYNDMITNQLADGISRSGSFGLARSLQSQLVRQVLPGADSAKPVGEIQKP
jgi:flagellar protein FlgJ